MNDRIINKAWSDVSPGDFVRWVTPRFVKYGVTLTKAGNSMTFDFLDEHRPRVLPDARWYYAQFKIHPELPEEYLCVIEALPDGATIEHLFRGLKDDGTSAEHSVSVAEACDILGMDPKQLRRHIRRGVVTASKNRDSQWVIDRDHLMSIAGKRGWL